MPDVSSSLQSLVGLMSGQTGLGTSIASSHHGESGENGKGPVTTSKALLVSVVAPRKIVMQSVAPSSTTTLNQTVGTTIREEDDEEGEEHGDDSKKQKTMTHRKNQFSDFLHYIQDVATTVRDSSIRDHRSDGSMGGTNSSRIDDGTISAEEAASIKIDEESTSIDLEELLRIAFRDLLQQHHLLNVPTFTLLMDKQMVTDATDVSWVRVDVMARPQSLGIVLDRLDRIGVGTKVGTISFYNAELCRTASHYAHLHPETNGKSSNDIGNELDDKAATERTMEQARIEWMNAATRLRIEQLREEIAEQVELSFDYVSLLTVAAILAGVGLISNNQVVIVASMLVSPIMGPVLGLTFGTRVNDWPLVYRSIASETISLLACIVIGAVIALGSVFCPIADAWPTDEMQGRGEPRGLLTGMVVAIVSGMGVCLSVVGANTSSLVGVAISASLLPPAVNAGICFVYAIFLKAGVVENETDTAGDIAVVGTISFLLTVLNIVCIWIAGIFMFKIKEVAPTKQADAFWHHDIQLAREWNRRGSTAPPPVNASILREGLQHSLAARGGFDTGLNEPVVGAHHSVAYQRRRANNASLFVYDNNDTESFFRRMSTLLNIPSTEPTAGANVASRNST